MVDWQVTETLVKARMMMFSNQLGFISDVTLIWS